MARYKKIIVTGANGYIGKNLLNRLKKEKINAIGIFFKSIFPIMLFHL